MIPSLTLCEHEKELGVASSSDVSAPPLGSFPPRSVLRRFSPFVRPLPRPWRKKGGKRITATACGRRRRAPLERTGGRGPFFGLPSRQREKPKASLPKASFPSASSSAYCTSSGSVSTSLEKEVPPLLGDERTRVWKEKGGNGDPSPFLLFHVRYCAVPLVKLARKQGGAVGGKGDGRGGHLGLHPQMSFRGVLLLRRSQYDVFERKREGEAKVRRFNFCSCCSGAERGGDDASASPIYFPFSPWCACVEKVGRGGGGLECVFLTHKDKQQQPPVLPNLRLKKVGELSGGGRGGEGRACFICVVYDPPLFFRRPVRSVQKRRRAGFWRSNGPLFPPPLSSRP